MIGATREALFTASHNIKLRGHTTKLLGYSVKIKIIAFSDNA